MNAKRKATEESKTVGNKCKASKVGETRCKSKQPLKRDLILQLIDLHNRFESLEKILQDVRES